MLRITEEKFNDDRTLLRLEGRLVDEWVNLLGNALNGHVPVMLTLELSGVSYASHHGLALLLDWQARGASLSNASLFLNEMLRQAQTDAPANLAELPEIAAR